MSYPTSRYPQVPLPSPSPPPTSPDFPYPGLRRTGSRASPRGRGLQATATFPPGSAIAAFPRPLLCLPDGEHVRTACDWCLRPGSTSPSPSPPPSSSSSGSLLSPAAQSTKLSACTGCTYVVYCSKRCQAAAWKAVHRLECAVLQRVRDGVFGATPGAGGTDGLGESRTWFIPTPVRAALQLLLRLKAGDARVRDAVGGGVLPFGGGAGTGGTIEGGLLEGNVDGFARDEKVWRDLGTQASAALRFAGAAEVEGVAAEGVRRVLCVLQTNAFDRRDEDVGAAGVFLDVDLAMANHSCVPNAYVCFVGRTAVLRAETEIKEGDEIEISYIGKSVCQVAAGVYKRAILLTMCQITHCPKLSGSMR